MIEGEPAPTVAAPTLGLWMRACLGEREAFAELAERYWYAVYVWLRAAGNAADAAGLQCRSFLTRLYLAAPPSRDEPTAARMREYVLVQLKNYATDGFPTVGEPVLPKMDASWAERRFAAEPLKAEDVMFNRRWALRVLELAVETLQQEYASIGKPGLYDAMKPFLNYHAEEQGYADAAKAVEMSTSAFQLQVFDFRKRYRTLLRVQIADTIRHADDVDSELTALLVGAT